MKPGSPGLSAEEAAKKMLPGPDQFTLAYGFAFAPNPDRQPPYFDFPFKDVEGDIVRDDAAWKKWEGGIADEVGLYEENFLKLKGIAVDYGTLDEYQWIPKGCVYFGEQRKQLTVLFILLLVYALSVFITDLPIALVSLRCLNLLLPF